VKLSTLWVMFGRSRMYVNILNFRMIGFLFFSENSIPFWYIFTMMIGLGAITLIDWFYVFSKELGRTSEKNPIAVETRNNTRKILTELKRINDDI